jgi:hypothetical protein
VLLNQCTSSNNSSLEVINNLINEMNSSNKTNNALIKQFIFYNFSTNNITDSIYYDFNNKKVKQFLWNYILSILNSSKNLSTELKIVAYRTLNMLKLKINKKTDFIFDKVLIE